MVDREILQNTISKNLTFYRKAAGLTQIQLAEKLNYSDKAVSKWERGDGIPDLFVLSELADIYGVTVDDLIKEGKKRVPIHAKVRALIAFMTAGIVGLVATLVFVFLRLIFDLDIAWIAFIYAIPVEAIVLTVLNAVWRKNLWLTLSVSMLVWGTLLSIFLSFRMVDVSIIFMIGIPMQLLTIAASQIKMYHIPN